jgi:maltooligosyltrehalose trehalohydrolase
MLFAGEEWAAATPFLYFTDHPEPELASAVREGRRREFAAFGWKPEEIPDPQAAETFARSKLNWNELNSPLGADLLDWHKKLIRLRRSEAALNNGRLESVEVHFDESARWLVLARGPITVVCNFQSGAQTIPLRSGKERRVLLASADVTLREADMRLPLESVAILKS